MYQYMKNYKLELYSDFNQILLSDEEWEGDDGPTNWTDKNINEFACKGTYIVGLGVIENDDHIITLTLHDNPPFADVDLWDHIVDIPFKAPSGEIYIGDEGIEIPKGEYVVRWSIKKLNEDSAEYKLDMWSGHLNDITVHKQLKK